MITKPQKAPSKSITDEELSLLPFPVFGSPKLDGFRCVTNNAAYTSSMKKVQNDYIQNILSHPNYAGLDGEICVGPANDPNVFNNTTGAVRRKDGGPAFMFYVFDRHDLTDHYSLRYESLSVQCMNLPFVSVLKQAVLHSPQEVIDYTNGCVEQGFEGAMIRTMQGKYKEGRCTLKEMNIFKRKPVEDDEAVVIGFEEQMENQNESFTNELGNTTRSTNKENLVGKNTLGKFVMQSPKWEEPFYCGTGLGLTEGLRKYIWENKERFRGQTVTYKFQKYGSIDAPRQPIWKGFRDIADMTGY